MFNVNQISVAKEVIRCFSNEKKKLESMIHFPLFNF